MADLTPAQLLAATAADMRKVADAAPPAPWDFNSYSAIFSGPLMREYDPWADPLIEAGHTLERIGECMPCGEWREPLSCGVQWSRGHGCRHSGEEYERDPVVARVQASAGDTSHGSHKAAAEHITAWDPDMARAVAPLLAGIADRHTNTPLIGAANPRGYCTACGGYYGGPTCADVTDALALCHAWWKSRGLEPKAVDHG